MDKKTLQAELDKRIAVSDEEFKKYGTRDKANLKRIEDIKAELKK